MRFYRKSSKEKRGLVFKVDLLKYFETNIYHRNKINYLTFKTFKIMPCGKKRKGHKISTHKRKKRLRKNRHKKK